MGSKSTSTADTRSLVVFPAGSNGEFNLPPELAMVIERGEGCMLWDTHGRSYVDFSMGWGSVLVGHGRPEVTDAVCRQAPSGANFAYVTNASLVLAEEIIRLSPVCQQLRFCASGTEATMYCLRLARAFSGKSKVLKFEGAYHGSHPVGLASFFPKHQLQFPMSEATSSGIDHLIQDQVLVAPFNDLETTQQIIGENASELAAVIVEPLHRCLPPQEGFLKGLRKVTTDCGLLLIFDEVVTGFRLAYGGAQEYYEVVPDLVAYGKALGGGYPIGVFGGRADIMDLVREDRLGRNTYVWSASTVGGNPISSVAAEAALEVYRQPGTYEHLFWIGKYMREGMQKVLKDCGIPGQIIGDGPLAQWVLQSENSPVKDYRSIKKGDARAIRSVMLGLFKRGIFLNPMGSKLYLSLAHNIDVCNIFFEHFKDAISHEFTGS